MLLKQSTARNRVVLMVDSADHIAGKTGLTLTVKASKDGAAFATITPTVTELEDGFYNLALTTTHTNTIGDLALHITGAGADPTDLVDQVVIDLPGVGQTGDNFARLGAPAGASVSADVAAVKGVLPTALVSGRIDASVGAAANDVITAAALATDAGTEIGSAVWAATTRVLTAGTNIALAKGTGVTGFNDLSAAAVNAEVDTAIGDAALATAVNLAVLAGYVDTEVAAIKAKTDNLPGDPADASDIAAALLVVQGFVDTEVSAIKAKTDLIPAAPAAVSDIPTATQNADILLNRDMAAVSDTNARSLLNALRFIRNRWDVASGTLTVKKEDDTTTAWTAAVSTSAGADPIVGNDPA